MNSKDITIVLTTCARSASMNRKFLSPMPFDFSTPHRRFLASPGFLCVSYHATTQMHKIGLPAQPQNCGVWKTVSLMLAGAYQNVAQRAPRCSNWQLFFLIVFCVFIFVLSTTSHFWEPWKKHSRMDHKEVNAICKDCKCEERSCEELTRMFGDMKLDDYPAQ